MPLNIPSADNPWGVAIRPASTHQIGLHAAQTPKYNQGDMLAEGFGAVSATMKRWSNEIDQTRAQDAINQFDAYLHDRRTNKDTGWANLNGKAALDEDENKRGLQERELDDFDDKVRSINESLSPGARKLFNDRYALAARMKLSDDLASHVVKQQKAYEAAVDNNTLASAADMILSGDVEQMRAGVEVTRGVLQKTANNTGVPIDASKFLGANHAAAIDQFVDAGNLRAARNWLKESSDEMTPAQRMRAKKSIEAGAFQAQVKATAARLLKGEDPLLEALSIKDEKLRSAVYRAMAPELKRKEMLAKHEASVLGRNAIKAVQNGESLSPSVRAELAASNPKLLESLDLMSFSQYSSIMNNAELEQIKAANTDITGKKNAMARAADFALSSRSKDMAASFMKENSSSWTPIPNANNSTFVGDELAFRFNNSLEAVSRKFNVPQHKVKLLANAEVEGIREVAAVMTPENKAKYFADITSRLPEAGRNLFLNQMRGVDEGVAQALRFSDGGATSMRKAFKALEARATGGLKADKSLTAEIYKKVGQEGQVAGLWQSGTGQTDMIKDLALMVDYQRANGQEPSVDDALKELAGAKVVVFHNKKVLMPENYSDTPNAVFGKSVLGQLQKFGQSIRQHPEMQFAVGANGRALGPLTAGQLASRLENDPAMQLQTVNAADGTVTCRVLYNGLEISRVSNGKNGKLKSEPLVLTFSDKD